MQFIFRLSIFVQLILVVGVAQGCSCNYAPYLLESKDGKVFYRLDISRRDDSFHTELTRQQEGSSTSYSLTGKAEAVALSPNGNMLVVAMSGSNARALHRAVIFQADSLTVDKQIPLDRQGSIPESDGYEIVIQRIDCMAISNDSKTLAIYESHKIRQGGYEARISLWKTETGILLNELRMPKPDSFLLEAAYGESVSSMSFSGDGSFLGVAGAWSIKSAHVEQPDGFIRVWRIADGMDVITLRPQGQTFLRDLCFDETNRHIAAWGWVGSNTRRSVVTIWSLPKGEKVAEKVSLGYTKSIRWAQEEDAYEIRTDKEAISYLKILKANDVRSH